MLQSMRNNFKGTIAFIIVGFLAFIMAASLVTLSGNEGSYNNTTDVAKVNDQIITDRDLQIGVAQERQRLQAQLGENIPPGFISDERLRGPVLNNLIQRSVLVDKALQESMTVSDSEIGSLIVQSDEFKIDGVFNTQAFMQAVSRIGHTPVTYRELLLDSIVANELQDAVVNTAFLTEPMIKQTVALSRQARDFAWVTLPLKDLPETMTVADEEIVSYYEANKAGYLTEEKVSIEYISMSVDDFLDLVEVAPEDIEQQYQQEVLQLTASFEREAAHIMVEAGSDNAEQRIQEVADKLAAGESFESLVADYSDDTGSKDDEGNLGTSSGDVFPEAFEAALAALDVGGVSEAVEVDGNTHFIKLLSLVEEPVPTLEESQERITSDLKTILAEELYIERLTELKDIAYNAETLSTVAQDFDTTMGTTELFTRVGGDDLILSDRRIIEAAFSDAVLVEGFTEVLELSNTETVVINLLEHEPVRTLTQDEKRDDIVADLKLDKAKKALAEKVDALAESLEGGQSLSDIAQEEGLFVEQQQSVFRNEQGVDRQLLEHVFSLNRPGDEAAISTSVLLSSNDYALVQLTAVTDADFESFSDEEKQNIRRSFSRGASLNEFQAWLAAIQAEATVEYLAGDEPTNDSLF